MTVFVTPNRLNSNMEESLIRKSSKISRSRGPTVNTKELCIAALDQSLLRQRPNIKRDARRYVTNFRDNLLDDIAPITFVADFEAGAGLELQSKILAPHSSSALAVNSFAWLHQYQHTVALAGASDLTLRGFERKFSTGLANAQPPHLDVVFDGTDCAVAIESKCTEYLSPQNARFSDRYRSEITDERSKEAWYLEMVRIMEGAAREYRYLDVAQLIKHALGLSYQAHKPTILLYLWWEPANASQFDVFAKHRAEIAEFGRRVAGSQPTFQAMTYPDLWTEWTTSSDPMVATKAAQLLERYHVSLGFQPSTANQ